MNIIIGHANMDIDCIASMVIASKLFPDYKPVKSNLIHPVAKKLYNMMKKSLDFLTIKDVENEPIENIVVVDTRSNQRIKEFSVLIKKATGTITVFDHHHSDSDDISGAVVNYMQCGSNTTHLYSLMKEKNIKLTPDEATIALSGIFADTGNFIHETTVALDFICASQLLEQGANIALVKHFLKSITEEHQINMFHEILYRLAYRDINGHGIMLSYIEIEDQLPGLAAVVENIFELENQDAFFAVFYLAKRNDTLIIARSRKEIIDLNRILSIYNGGGHKLASSATIKKAEGKAIYDNILKHLEENIPAAASAGDIMSKNLHTINENMKLLNASIFLEEINCTGAPVINDNGELTGILTLRDIMKGRKAGQIHSPVKAYMSKNVVSVNKNISVKEVEKVLYKNNIGHLPVMENNKLAGILTRTDVIRHLSCGI
ncbi:MAG: CBS domain-containing protein [Spirochaetes bacterium]|nr:CBS domain-containing protein [Spirochaetota bacterium]